MRRIKNKCANVEKLHYICLCRKKKVIYCPIFYLIRTANVLYYCSKQEEALIKRPYEVVGELPFLRPLFNMIYCNMTRCHDVMHRNDLGMLQ